MYVPHEISQPPSYSPSIVLCTSWALQYVVNSANTTRYAPKMGTDRGNILRRRETWKCTSIESFPGSLPMWEPKAGWESGNKATTTWGWKEVWPDQYLTYNDSATSKDPFHYLGISLPLKWTLHKIHTFFWRANLFKFLNKVLKLAPPQQTRIFLLKHSTSFPPNYIILTHTHKTIDSAYMP